MVADEIWAKKAQNGDTAAFGELVRRHQDNVYGMALRMLATPEDARDAVQEIFIRAYRSLPGFDFRASFTTWLYRVSTSVCLDLLRRRGRERRHQVPLDEGAGGALWDQNPGPEETLLDSESLGAVRQAVDALPDGYRLALVLHHYQGLSYKQVAEAMDLSEKTVATRIFRAKKKLKEKLLGGEGGAVSESKGKVGPVSGRRMQIL